MSSLPLSIATGPTDQPLLTETIPANLARTVSQHGAREALVACHQDIRWSYAEFHHRVQHLARALMALGLGRGERIGLWSPNYAEWTLVQYATAEIGAILVNINPAYRTHELAYALNQSGCRMLIAAPRFKSSDYVAMVAAVRDECPDVVLMDIHLAGDMDGIDAAKKVQGEFDVPVIYLTGDAMDDTVEEAREAQAYGYLLKPINDRDDTLYMETKFNCSINCKKR